MNGNLYKYILKEIIYPIMQRISAEQLKKQGIDTKTALEINFNSKVYQREKFFAKQYQQNIEKFCQKYQTNGHDILIVEYNSFVSIWIEKKEIKEATLIQANYQKITDKQEVIRLGTEAKENDIATDSNCTSSLAKVTKQYRGVTYEVDKSQSDLLARNKTFSPQKVTKQYRGITYEVEQPQYNSDSKYLPQKVRKYRGRIIEH